MLEWEIFLFSLLFLSICFLQKHILNVYILLYKVTGLLAKEHFGFRVILEKCAIRMSGTWQIIIRRLLFNSGA